MGQSPSASRANDDDCDGVGGGEGPPKLAMTSRDDGSDGEENPCAGGCLAAPRCLLPYRRWGGCSRDAFNDDFVEGGTELASVVNAIALTMEEEEPPPDALALSDVDDDNDEDENDGISDEKDLPKDGREGREDVPTKTNDTETLRVIPEDVLSRLVAVDCGMVQLRSKKKNGGKKKTKKKNKRKLARGGSANNSVDSPEAGAGAGQQYLRRVCIVDGYGKPLLSALVRVDDPSHEEKNPQAHGEYYSSVARYLSNLLPRHHEPRINCYGDDMDLGVPANQIRKEAANLLTGKIVVGHQVEGDLAILGLGKSAKKKKWGKRDFEVRDTAYYRPFQRNGRGEPRKLQELVKERLKRKIQVDGEHHCCEEDAVAALDLYKSVWHEWEKRLGETGLISTIQKQQVKPKEGKGSVQQPRNPATNSQTTTSKSRKKRKGTNKEDTTLTKAPARRPQSSYNDLLVKYYSCCASIRHHLVPSLGTLLSFPIVLPARMVHDITHLTREAMISATRHMQQPTGLRILPNDRMKKTRLKKNKKRPPTWVKKHHFDSFFLLCHCFLEVWCIVLSGALAQWDATSMHSANGALAIGLLGMNLFQRRQRNDKASRTFFRILAQYRIISALVRMIGYGTVDSQTIHAVQDHGVSRFMTFGLDDRIQHTLLISERMASALARHIRFATPMAFVTDVKPLRSLGGQSIAINTAGALVLQQILPFMQTNIDAFKGASEVVISAAASHCGVLPLACDVALSFWFALRAAKKL